jgi:serine phosphatase RsbU (regulator of sigma subunit)
LKLGTDLVFIAAADCTGHGVPGAIVSMICHNALNRTLFEYEITEPGKILNITRELIISTFEKGDADVKDGMDISICCLNKKTNELQWAGANNPLWIIRNDSHVIEELSPNKQPVGKVDGPKPFDTQKVQLQKGDLVYLFTDGYADQFGGPKGKKFKYRQLEELLLKVHELPLDLQKRSLQEGFEEWKGKLAQVDDVCVIGFKA